MRKRYLSSSQMIIQTASREMRESREVSDLRNMRKINNEMKMIEKTKKKQFKNNSNDINIEDED
jgi:hypothetical protein